MRPKTPRTWSAAPLVVGGRDDLRASLVLRAVLVLPCPRAQLVDGRLEVSDGGAERAGDQMQLVLDDQVRRTEPGSRFRHILAPAAPRLVPIAASVLLVEVIVPVSVPGAPLGGAAEKQAGLAVPRQRRELVDGDDQQARQQPVDLLVHRQHRDALAVGLAAR
ncbi:hypothetical protein [Streptomyces cacaoi]|uniref:hypothetical protein n=1 Tax=Streptomyces cacaoi TaxID=1898 RepID=UPI0033BC8542